MSLTKLELAIRDRAAELYRRQELAPTPEEAQILVLRRYLLRDLAEVLVLYEARCREGEPK